MSRRTLPVIGLLAAACLLLPPAAHAQDEPLVTSRYRADLRFRAISSGRFDIYFHQGEEALAQRLARITQQIAPEVDGRLGAPRGRVRIILVDQSDVSNGWATVIPYNLIEIAAVPPRAADQIGNTDDWLRTVFAHEYTHIVHLEKSRGLLGGLRTVFGRIPIAYSNLFVPGWQIEGLATFEESDVTGLGRIAAGDFRMLIDEAARHGTFMPLDRAGGGVVNWPAGAIPYLYGAYFHEYLAERFGKESLGRLADATAGRLPYFASGAFRTVYGESLGSLWKRFEADTRSRADTREAGASAARARLTTHGFDVTSPAFAGDGRLFYSVANPHGFPALMELRDGEAPRAIATRYHGNRIAAAGDTLVFDQLEVSGHVDLVSDLYALDTRSGDVRRLTRDARAADPDVSPDGQTIVCTVQHAGRRILATLRVPPAGQTGVPSALVSAEATEFSSPRWSPDGKALVAERRQLGGPSEIVVIDVATRRVSPLVSSRQTRNVSPAWLPDGETVLFSSTREEGGFTLYAIERTTGSIRRLAGAGIGAQSPAVSPDGRRIVYVAYSADGYDLYSLPLASVQWIDVPRPTAPEDVPAPPTAAEETPLTSRPYSPLDTLAPRFWIPYFEADGEDTVVGAATGGFDALGRHTYAASAGWALERAQADVYAEYSYTRWRPALFAGISDDTDTWGDGTFRSREASVGVLLPFRRVRWNSNLLTSLSASRDDLFSPSTGGNNLTRRRTAARIGWSLSNARRFGYSISAEQGAALKVVSEFAAGGSASGGHAQSFVGELRAYVRAIPRHGVLALRVAGATSRGDDRVRREFSAAGSGPRASDFGLGVDAIGLLRGFAEDDVFGRSAAVANIDYRFPLAWPQRGRGTLPLLLRSAHGAVFADVGTAWDGGFRAGDLRRSFGGELSFDVVVGWTVPVTIATGAAWRHDPTRAHEGFAAFVRVGRAF